MDTFVFRHIRPHCFWCFIYTYTSPLIKHIRSTEDKHKRHQLQGLVHHLAQRKSKAVFHNYVLTNSKWPASLLGIAYCTNEWQGK
jgi:hypothetical protein